MRALRLAFARFSEIFGLAFAIRCESALGNESEDGPRERGMTLFLRNAALARF